jgi:Carboxypeptidase regulatory-like domain
MRFCCLFVLACFPALAQLAPTTSVSGTVADPSGSVMPNAALELTNTATRWTRHTTTDDQGRFQFTLLPRLPVPGLLAGLDRRRSDDFKKRCSQ